MSTCYQTCHVDIEVEETLSATHLGVARQFQTNELPVHH